jgi:NADPH:quinone reductase-like Zn-dependent oxidoreductase
MIITASKSPICRTSFGSDIHTKNTLSDREAIRLEDVPVPKPGPTDVRIEVRACALNWLDVAVRRGPKFGAIPLLIIGGGDIAGVIDTVGPEVDSWKTGDVSTGSHSGTEVTFDLSQV